MNTNRKPKQRGALLIEVIVAFALFTITAVGLAQFMALRVKTDFTATLTTCLDRQLHVLGGYLASCAEPGPIFSDTEVSNALTWARLGQTHAKNSENSSVIGTSGVEMLPIVTNATGVWIYPLPQDYEETALGQPTAMGAFSDAEWHALDPEERRVIYWQAVAESTHPVTSLQFNLGGGGEKTRDLANGEVKRAKGLPYDVHIFQEVTYVGARVCVGNRANDDSARCPNDWSRLEWSLNLPENNSHQIDVAELLVVFRLRASLNLIEGNGDLVNTAVKNNDAIVVENAYAKVI
jgi:hypothetical protein